MQTKSGSGKVSSRTALKRRVKSIGVVTEDPLSSAGLKASFGNEAKFCVEEWKIDAALEAVGSRVPRILIANLSHAWLHDRRTSVTLSRLARKSKLILLLAPDDIAHIAEYMKCGVLGYLLKTCAPSELLHAVETVGKGEFYLSPEIPKLAQQRAEGDSSPTAISPQEQRVLEWIVDGAANQEIAARLQLCVRTVEHHRASVMRKAGVRSVAALMKFAIRQGILRLD